MNTRTSAQGVGTIPQIFTYFHLPKAGMRYYAGVDVASGTGGSTDDSTMSIFSADGVQVATFYTNQVPVYRFAEVVNSLGRFTITHLYVASVTVLVCLCWNV